MSSQRKGEAQERGGGGRLQALTARELEVLVHVTRYLHNREIAAILVISEATVKRHMEDVLAALGAKSRQEAADIYRREMGDDGLVEE